MKLRKATIDDWKILLEWRNDIDTRKNSHNMELVQEEEYQKWLNSVLENDNQKLYIWFENRIPAGTIRSDWDNKTKSFELSWTVSPNFRRQGIGKKMVKYLAEKMNHKLRAEVKIGNVASIKIAEFAGLKFKYENNGILYFANY